MADGGHIGAIALLVEFEESPGQIGAVALLTEFDESIGKVGAVTLLVEFEESPGQIGAIALLTEFDESISKIGAVALLTEFDASAGQVGAIALLSELDASAGVVGAAALLVEGEVPPIGMVGAAALLVEGELNPLGLVGAVALLAELNDDRGVFDARTLINDRTAALIVKIAEWKDRYRALIDAGDAVLPDFRSLQTQIRDCREEIVAIRAVLDPLKVRTALAFFDPVSLIKLWNWRSNLLFDLVRLDSQLRVTLEDVEEILAGTVARIVVSRAGETLQTIAARELGSQEDWRRIADANGLTPGPLEPGTSLVIPEKR